MNLSLKLLTILMIIAASLWGQGFPVQSVRWQKIQLEEKISQEIKLNLKSILSENQMMIKVNMIVEDPGPLDFQDDKNDVSKQNQNKLKISDISFDQSQGDYIAFSKVGLEVPILDNYLSEEKIDPIEIEKKKIQMQDFALKSQDLFYYLKQIKIKVLVTDTLPEDVLNIVKNVLNSLSLNYGGVVPQIEVEFSQFNFENPIKPKKLFENYGPMDYIDLMSRFNGLLGALVGSFILGFILYLLLKSYLNAKANMGPMQLGLSGNLQMNPQQDPNKENKDESQNGANSPSINNENPSFDSKIVLKRFEKMIKHKNTDAITLMKKWLSMLERKESYKQLMSALGQQMDFDIFQEFLLKFSQQERLKIGQYLQKTLSPMETINALHLLNEELIQMVVVPNEVKDPDLLDAILNIDIDSAKRLIQDHPTVGAYLLRVSSGHFSSQVIAQMDNQLVEEVLQKALVYKVDDVNKNPQATLNILNQYQSHSEVLPFASKVLEMLGELPVDKEEFVFKSLAHAKQWGSLGHALNKVFPAHLIYELPHKVIEEIFKVYPLQQKIDYLFCQNEASRSFILDIIAPSESTLRDLIEMEFENLRIDEAKVEKIEEESGQINLQFIRFVREFIKIDPQFQNEVNKVLNQYLDRLRQKNSPNQSKGPSPINKKLKLVG